MIRIAALPAALCLVLATAAYAGTPSPDGSTPVRSKTLALNSQGSVVSSVPIFSAANPNVPGATGRVIVRGNNSTIAGDAAATRMQQTGTIGGE